MATLVLSSLGTAVGGPIGGAVGAMLGQSIDRSIFSGGPRTGPRLGDLSVQTSSYGTPVPRVYGKMRVAGTVVWATALKESQTLTSGAKGPAGTLAYAYSVSLAVALSSRAASGVGRIWADGKLLRGSAGDFKVRTEFRFYSGDGDQALDPLMAATEGLLATPAYRGLALAVFQDLDLASFGNRIPVLTFELIADEDVPSLGNVIADASIGDIQCEASTQIGGFAAHGLSIRAGVAGLIETFGMCLQDDGELLIEPSLSPTLFIKPDEIGCAQVGETSAKTRRWQEPATTLPARVSLSYYEPERDYQSGVKQALMRGGRRLDAIDLPAAMSSASARSLVEQIMARTWGERDRLQVQLPSSYLDVQVGQRIVLQGDPAEWRVEEVTIQGLVVQLELKRSLVRMTEGVAGDAGRIVQQVDLAAQPTILALLDLPAFDFAQAEKASPSVVLAASRASDGWAAVPVTFSFAGGEHVERTCGRKAVIGKTLNALRPAASCLIDCVNALDVELSAAGDWLQSCDDASLAGRANLLAVGQEIIQFGDALPLGDGRFRLRRLLRGRGGTEWAAGLHLAGERVVLIDAATLLAVPLPSYAIGATLSAQASGLGDGGKAVPESLVVSGEALRPPSPVHLKAKRSRGALQLDWSRRSRLGWSWVDGNDAPLGEDVERYRAILKGASGTIEQTVTEPACLFKSIEILSVGSNPTVTVEHLGTYGLSRPTSLIIS